MNSVEKDIHGLLQKAAIDGALTQEAVKYVDEIIEKNASLTRDNELKAKKVSDLLKDQATSTDLITKLNTEVCEWIKRDHELAEREKAITTLELTAKHEAVRVEDHKDMFDKVFRNIETRRNVFTPYPGATAVDQYGNIPAGAQGYVQTDEEKTESK